MRTLFVAALEEESRALAEHVTVHHLGVGKVQAAASLAALLADHPADRVVNVGTAGGLHHQRLGEVVEVARVHQHDFDHVGVGRLVGREMPGGPIELSGPPGASGRLATGDRVIASEQGRARLAEQADVVDMEGYAIASVARRFGCEVWIAKAVSDSADVHMAVSWREALTACADSLASWAQRRGLV